MVIVTARAREQADGCLVGFSTQCSIDPLHFLVCLSKANRTLAIALESSTLVVHLLHATQRDNDLARLFGGQTGYDVDKLQRCRWSPGPDAVPVLDGCDWLGGLIVEHFDLGDHVGFLVAVNAGSGEHLDEPWLTYAHVRDLDPGNPA